MQDFLRASKEMMCQSYFIHSKNLFSITNWSFIYKKTLGGFLFDTVLHHKKKYTNHSVLCLRLYNSWFLLSSLIDDIDI